MPRPRVQKVLAGECDIALSEPADIASLKANADVNLLEQAGLNIGYMGYNTTLPPLDKPGSAGPSTWPSTATR